MRWFARREGGRFRGAPTTYLSADDLMLWTYQLEELNGSSLGLEQPRKLITDFRSKHID